MGCAQVHRREDLNKVGSESSDVTSVDYGVWTYYQNAMMAKGPKIWKA